MPADLRKAHQALDRAVDRLYQRSGFTSERERVEHLLGLYEKMVAPLAAKAKPKRRGTGEYSPVGKNRVEAQAVVKTISGIDCIQTSITV